MNSVSTSAASVVKKRCPRCGETKDRSAFSPRSRAKPDGHVVSQCKPCAAATSREWRDANLDYALRASRQSGRQRHLKHAYGITEKEYDEMVARQRGGCAICRDPPTNRHGRLYVDHDHATGRVRGLVCEPCNHGLGRFRDRRDLLVAATKYLDQGRCYVGGTFDLPHAGHVELLRAASNIGPVTVALNTDDFAARYKRRPVMQLAERKTIIESFRYVDEVVVNVGGKDSRPTILRVRPTYIVHGDDWTGTEYLNQLGVTQDWLDTRGITIRYLPYTHGVSTSGLIERATA